MENFTPWSALAGGALIGLAASLLWAGNGRIAGISGMLHGLLAPGPGERLWRALFLAGMVIGAGAWLWFAPPAFAPREGYPLPLAAAAGVLVGAGTLAGSGCTSGHGVCGLGRMSLRSLAAVLAFMGSGAATVFVLRHILGVN